MSELRDPFRPPRDPARALYDAFQAEAVHRKGRDLDEWIKKERDAVWRAARDYAQQHDLRVLTMKNVESAERMACGHIDYGSTWAHGIVRFWQKDVAKS